MSIDRLSQNCTFQTPNCRRTKRKGIYFSYCRPMNDFTSKDADVPLEIIVFNESHGRACTTPPIRPSISTSFVNPLSDARFLPIPLPSRDRWKSSPQSESKHTQAFPRLPRRNRTQPLEFTKNLFQIEVVSTKTHQDTTMITTGAEGYIDDRMQRIMGMRMQLERGGQQQRIVRSESDGAIKKRARLSPTATDDVRLPI
ncbi:hypothetical protein IV203_027978 [Nitzschia inconspicua]|uniref:Uncharacterized protein n=1 Tax=Nitzschia inconspicua TaxID=303405 RepID=A0A9K3LXP2_9STRA|nr:hypothetical protein IV203_027978 [Nitzschia inconspicua]